MAKAARAIIIENDEMLVMKRIKQGITYYTLVGGRINDGESPEAAITREVREETGLQITSAQLVFIENHPEPYNDQAIFLCQVAPHGPVEIQSDAEEAIMNKIDINIHIPEWVRLSYFPRLPFHTMNLQKAIAHSLERGFPDQPISL